MGSSITSSSTSPYNITLTSDSPTINYLPYRDGPATGGWNMSCSGSDPSTYIPQTFCLGVASRQSSFVGASLYVDFLGTAAYFFGTGDALSFTLQVDGQVRNDLIVSNPSSGLLAKVENLSYDQHRIYLNVTQSVMLSLDEVVLTIAIGQSYSSSVRNQTIVPFTQTSSDGSPTLNKNFIYTGDWMTDVPGTIGVTGDVIYPRQHTSETGAYVTFQVSQTSAFFIYGLVNVDLGPFSVTLTPPSDLGQPITNFYNSNAHYIGLDRVMYWTSGLDRDRVYVVKITNLGQDATPWWDFNRIDLLDGGFNTTDKATTRKHHKVSVGPIAGAIAAGLLLLALSILGWILCRRKTRARTASVKKPKLDMIHESQENKPFLVQSTTYPGVPGDYIPFPPRHTQDAGYPYAYNPPQHVVMHVTPSRTNLNVASSSARTPLPLQPQPQPPQPQPQDTGSPDLSYTKSGVIMSWNSGSGDPSGLSGQGMGPAVPVVREQDAGTLLPATGGEAVFQLPPNYNDSWSRDRVQ